MKGRLVALHGPPLRQPLRVLVVGCALGLLPQARGEWSATTHGTMFYTDDVGVFSATRRLTLDGDPTQPALDNRLTGRGSDAVFEPMLDVARSFATRYAVASERAETTVVGPTKSSCGTRKRDPHDPNRPQFVTPT